MLSLYFRDHLGCNEAFSVEERLNFFFFFLSFFGYCLWLVFYSFIKYFYNVDYSLNKEHYFSYF